MRRMTYDSTLKRIEISSIETNGMYSCILSRWILTSPGRFPNQPSHPRIAARPTTMRTMPIVTKSEAMPLLSILNTYRWYTRAPLITGYGRTYGESKS